MYWRKIYMSSYIGRRNLKLSKTHWETLFSLDDGDNRNYKINKPIILCFSGAGTTKDEYANWLCKIAGDLVGAKDSVLENETFEMIDILGIVYNSNDISNYGAIDNKELKNLFDKIILPLLYDEKNELLPANLVAKNLSLITFFSFCYGSEIVYLLCNKIVNKLLTFNYSYEEILLIMSSMMHVSYAPFCHSSLTPMISVLSSKDKFNAIKLLNYSYENSHNKIITKLNSNDISYISIDEIYPDERLGIIFPEIAIYCQNLSDGLNNDEHNPINISREHDTWAPVINTNSSNCVSQMIGYALALSLANGLDNFNSNTLIKKPSFSTYKNDLIEIMNGFNYIKDGYLEK